MDKTPQNQEFLLNFAKNKFQPKWTIALTKGLFFSYSIIIFCTFFSKKIFLDQCPYLEEGGGVFHDSNCSIIVRFMCPRPYLNPIIFLNIIHFLNGKELNFNESVFIYKNF